MITVDPEFFARSVLIKATILAFVLSVCTLFVFKIPVASGLVFGSLLDISTFFLILKGLKEFIRSRSLKTIVFAVTLRGIIKVIILFIAVFNPLIFNFWTASTGILIVEITIVLEAIRLSVFGETSIV